MISVTYFLLLLCLTIQLWHWYRLFWLPTDKVNIHPKEIPISIIICFNKKPDNIIQTLEWVNQLRYQNFELLLIIDGLEFDWTEDEKKFIHKPLHKIKYHFFQKKKPGKRGALHYGIQQAKNEWFVFTDIDCQPSKYWLSEISNHIQSSNRKIIIGLSPYRSENTLLNTIIQHETFLTANQYLGWAKLGKPYMAVGRNLIYHRSLYQSIPFFQHNSLPYGDDDLWINYLAQGNKVGIMYSKPSWVYSYPSKTWKTWYQQKKRHLSAGKYYHTDSKWRISIFSLILGIEKVLLCFLIFYQIPLFIGYHILKTGLLYPAIKNQYKQIGMVSSPIIYTLYEWFHFIYLLLLSPYIFYKSKPTW